MVLADRTAENVRNGRRSRGPSPNGHSVVLVAGGITESSSDDENSRKNGNSSKAAKAKSEYEEKIRVGRDYQAVCPELIPAPDRKPENLNDRALLVWSPTKEIPDIKLEEYITVAKEKYGYNGEQALGMLFWHKHDLERAVLDLANFTPFPDEWTVEDKVLFEQAFQFHGKSFHRIRQMLPDKSIASLVKFYYSWKKTRSRTSVMDRQEKMKKNDSSENGSDHGSNEDSDNDDKPSASTGSNPVPSIPVATNITVSAAASSTGIPSMNGIAPMDTNDSSKPGQMEVDGEPAIASTTAATNGSNTSNSLNCSGCGVTCSELNATPQGKLCGSCYHHWRRTGVLRPTSGPTFMNKRARNSTLLGKSADSHKRRPPRGMYINHDDIVKLADSAQITSGATEGKPCEDLLAGMDREIVSLWSQIQLNKQCASGLKRKIEQNSDMVRPAEPSMIRVNSRWNNEELLLAVQGVRKFGRDFQAIADTIGTKTETQVRTFFVNYRRKYSLDNVLKEYETEQKQLLEQINNNNNLAKEDDSTTTISELESADTSSTTGDKLELDDGKKSSGKKSVPLDSEIMEIDLVDDEMVNGKKGHGEDGLDGSSSTVTASGVTSASSLPSGSLSVTSVAPGTPASAAMDGAAPMDVDEQSSTSAKLTDSTIVIK
ncbi:REST corepressor isoform X1 [Topomyia yanbarensis]|uniref:REST corepressor isoform X1 n=1 Tax=Topomyia yanbarensis TaxID=2498891 RepID=UPI00273C9AD6|nr:REST corepressor isoform X1 [Topomyia yanbarensis]XP_058826076.1 REST corepressor isoform X1 [Topomyia yanbarensis]XP_058826077.1 REST corepressor isoform X1 [Topomyia yanbarensis]XP_058826078.1 REST corepressor isoform X1 [Topomyia yanbarensis]XP_058826079.1 REST corepressor isoform X1 [Topomyia yanbarensis]